MIVSMDGCGSSPATHAYMQTNRWNPTWRSHTINSDVLARVFFFFLEVSTCTLVQIMFSSAIIGQGVFSIRNGRFSIPNQRQRVIYCQGLSEVSTKVLICTKLYSSSFNNHFSFTKLTISGKKLKK
jgi:hypothetical protein